jgi:hypothetical protein
LVFLLLPISVLCHRTKTLNAMRSVKPIFIIPGFIVLLFLSSSMFGNTGSGGQKKSTKRDPAPDCLEVCAKAMLGAEEQTGLTIKLYCGSEEIMRIDSTEWSKVYFTLKKDKYYTLEISREGYVPRLVGISTKVPKHVPLKPIFRFEFEVDMLEKTEGTDNFYLDFPVALVSFNPQKECFEHSRKYTNRIKKELNKQKPQDPLAIKE